MAVNIKPAGKVAIVVILVAVAFFVIKPLVGKKKADPVSTEIKQDSLDAQTLDSISPAGPAESIEVKQFKKPVIKPVNKPVVKPVPVKKAPVKPVEKKKNGERENLDVKF
jgi:hypothetical protein